MSVDPASPLAVAGTGHPAASSAPAQSGRNWFTLGGTLIGLILMGVGIWRIIDDLRPVPELGAMESLFRRGKLDEVETGLRSILGRSPEYGSARRLLAQLLARRGDKLACARELSKIPRWWPGKRDEAFIEGQSYLDSKHAQEAEQAYLTCVQDDPLHPADPGRVSSAARSLLTLYMTEERLPEAQDILWQAYAQALPEELGAILNMQMRALVERIEPKEVSEVLGGYLAADATNWQARRGLARAEELLGRTTSADALLAQCLKERPDSIDAWRMRLSILVDRNQPETLAEAIRVLPGSIAQAGDGVILEAQGIDRINAGEFKPAQEFLEAALKADPFNPDTLYRLASVEQRLGLAEEAEAHRLESQKIRKARQAIPEALVTFRNRERPGAAKREERIQAMEELATICETVGWDRLGREWRNLATRTP